MTPDLAIGHALGALLLDMAKGMAALAAVLFFVVIAAVIDGAHDNRVARRWTDPGGYRGPSVWERRSKDDAWRGHGIE